MSVVLQDKHQLMDRAARVFLDKEEGTEQALNLALGSEEKKKRYFELTNKVLCFAYLEKGLKQGHNNTVEVE